MTYTSVDIKNLPAGAWVLRMPIALESHTENFIMKPKNHRSINTAVYACKVSGLQGKA
jgi:hypothetical protein